MKKTNDFPLHVSRFLTDYLAGTRNLSANTIISYRDTIVQLIAFIIQELSINLENISTETITKEVVENFLDHIEMNKGCSINTRNQRLSAIHSLFRYIGMNDPIYIFQTQQILSIPKKKHQQKEISYLTAEETKTLLSAPDVSTWRGRRDQALLCLLYDSGCRVQELADLTVRNVRIKQPMQVKLTGKGRKTRNVPLMNETATILNNYILENGLDKKSESDHPLFFNCQGKRLTRQGITYILKKYTTVNSLGDISPHSLRHSKAIHLTEADVNPIFIRDFLGHSNLKTTEIYSKSSVETKRKAIEKLTGNPIIPKGISSNTGDWTKDKDLMEWLKSL